ncbi:MAG: thioesterase family protein [Gammaproteobacteria bacterium]|nr:thioesterase family protein [Gammaproteobacteria bacterium]
MTDTAFLTSSDGEWFVGNDAARGPWSANHCHAGPVAGVFARAFESLITDKTLVRLSAVFIRPVPIAGFRVNASITRNGRTVATATADLKDAAGIVCATADSLHMAVRDAGVLPSAAVASPDFNEAVHGVFPIAESHHQLPTFGDAVEIAYPPGETAAPGPTTLWMRTPPLLADEQPSPFQRLCPLADCGNAISRNAELTEASFVNPEITIACFRAPQSDWLASRAISFWEPTGIGLASAALFDEMGMIGTALQTLIVEPVRR